MSNGDINSRNWYTVKEFAELIGKKPSTVYSWKKQRILKTFKASPRCLAVPASEYERYQNGSLMEPETTTT